MGVTYAMVHEKKQGNREGKYMKTAYLTKVLQYKTKKELNISTPQKLIHMYPSDVLMQSLVIYCLLLAVLHYCASHFIHPAKNTTQEGYSGIVECPFCNPVPKQRVLLLHHQTITGLYGHVC